MRTVQDLARVWRVLGSRAFTSSGPCSEVARAYGAAIGADCKRQDQVALAGGSPPLAPGRKVFITAPAKTAGQHGIVLTADSSAPVWRVEVENTQSKWTNPLMGWTSTSDPWENVNRSNLVFQTKDAAIAFAEKQGWSYEIQVPNPRPQKRPKRFQGYGDNYSVHRKGIPVGGLRSEAQGKKK